MSKVNVFRTLKNNQGFTTTRGTDIKEKLFNFGKNSELCGNVICPISFSPAPHNLKKEKPVTMVTVKAGSPAATEQGGTNLELSQKLYPQRTVSTSKIIYLVIGFESGRRERERERDL